jgi:hypothetical protein
VNPIHVVTKRAGLIVVKNKDDKFVPTCIQLGWRAWIDYGKVHAVTRKDYGQLYFVVQDSCQVQGPWMSYNCMHYRR